MAHTEDANDLDRSEIRPADLLAAVTLCPTDGRGSPDPTAEPISTVRCGRPLSYPVPVGDLPAALRQRIAATGERCFGVLFALDLAALPTGHRYSSARLQVRLADPRVIALRLDQDADSLGLGYGPDGIFPASGTAARTLAAGRDRPGWLGRLLPRSGEARPWPTGTQSHRFGWAYHDPEGDHPVPHHLVLHALVAAPAGTAELTGTLAVQVEVVRSLRGRRHPLPGDLHEAVPFTEPLPIAATGPTGAAVRLCVAADVEGYSRRGNASAARIQRHLVELLASARRQAGVHESAVDLQPQGDGQFAVLPAGIDESVVVPGFLAGLRPALAEANRQLGGDAIRLRVALHRGLVEPGANGWVGSAAIAVHRLLDSAPVRAALREHPGPGFVVVLPDFLYQDVVLPGPMPVDGFQDITVELPEKNFVARGWLRVCDLSG